MKHRKLGQGLEVSAIGLGCMGFSHAYGPATEMQKAIRIIRDAVEIWYTFFDTAEIYGPYHNEDVLGEALNPFRDQVVIATKFGIAEMNENTGEMRFDSRPETIRKSVEGSLKRLQTDRIDLYYQHRQDPNVPVEIVAETMGKLINEGKILHWGLSEVDADTIRRAHTVCPVAAVQNFYSMMYRESGDSVLPTLIELGISLVPYSPLASGFLSGTVTKETVFGEGDIRPFFPQFQADNMDANQVLLNLLQDMAVKKNATKSQIALAWVLAQNDRVIPIPGTRKKERLIENAGAANVALTEEEVKTLTTALDNMRIAGMEWESEPS
jgi:aryl-alcohol dehydrogenase-like predicted oxidoreductase